MNVRTLASQLAVRASPKLRGREDPRPRPLPSPGENNARTVRSARSVHGHPRPSTANELSRSRWTVPRALTDRPNALQRRRCRDRELTKANGSATTPPGQRPINGAVTGAYWSLGDEHRAAQRGQGQGQLALDRLHGTARHGVGVRLVAVAGGQLDGDLASERPRRRPSTSSWAANPVDTGSRSGTPRPGGSRNAATANASRC